jgi:hypothetical protein
MYVCMYVLYCAYVQYVIVIDGMTGSQRVTIFFNPARWNHHCQERPCASMRVFLAVCWLTRGDPEIL